ncbi:MAG: hypothetical protein C7B45_05890 [Sulfobacillus acidophilus]|uniref:Uncharacterized protein n=1 Tax=Sulfobacillus acidophilus TaxID=53633 RepID=A0A2T2WKH7_9FIRM|nr:MAG: hypothetical protein C7B45_05890 [Sulfobacillus acidophilus]
MIKCGRDDARDSVAGTIASGDDDLPTDKLAALADLIHTLIDEDDEPVGAEEAGRVPTDEMRRGKPLSFDDIFPSGDVYTAVQSLGSQVS